MFITLVITSAFVNFLAFYETNQCPKILVSFRYLEEYNEGLHSSQAQWSN